MMNMKKRDIVFLVMGILVGLILVLFFRACWPERPTRPEIGGQAIPDTRFVIDFSKRYNIICSQYQGGRSYENVRIVGYTGTQVRESSGQLSKGYGYFNHWLVVERVDARKVYLPIGSVSFLEEIEQQNK
jgi:hypothetical protein